MSGKDHTGATLVFAGYAVYRTTRHRRAVTGNTHPVSTSGCHCFPMKLFITAGDGLDSAAEMLSVNSLATEWASEAAVVSQGQCSQGLIHRHWSATRGGCSGGHHLPALWTAPDPKHKRARDAAVGSRGCV